MPQILVWKCPHTKKLFEDKALYTAHLKSLSRARLAEKKRQVILKARASVFERMRTECGDSDEIANFIKENWVYFLENAGTREFPNRKRKPPPDLISIDIILSMNITEYANSHSAPIGERSEFTKSRRLPAFVGSIRYSMSSDINGFSSSLFEGTGINTGTGGGGFNNQQYHLVLWEKDWPKLTHNRQMADVFKKLSMD